MDNPGESHANLLMDEFGITEGSARNLKTRVLKLGLIPNSNVDSEPASFPQMSAEGDYIQQVLEGKIKEPLPPSEWFALQEKRKRKGRCKMESKRNREVGNDAAD